MVITIKSQAQTQDGVLCSISVSDSGMVIIKNLEIVFVLRPELEIQESRDWSVLYSGIILRITYS